MTGFISGRDYEAYETPERARERRQDDAATEMAQHAYDPRVSYQGNRGELSPNQTTFPAEGVRGPNEASRLADKYGKRGPIPMDFAELAEGPNLPHRDAREGISTLAYDASQKAGYYHTGIDAFSTDAYMEQPSPIDRKARTRNTYHNGAGEAYVLPQGLTSGYRRTNKDGVTKDPHQQNAWGRPRTASNKHLVYWRNPTETEALRNLNGGERAAIEPARWQLTVPRDMLVMLARVHDIQAQRGKLHGDARGDMLREIAAHVEPGEMVTLELFTPAEVQSMTQGLPKRYKTGEFGQFLRDTATFAKLNK